MFGTETTVKKLKEEIEKRVKKAKKDGKPSLMLSILDHEELQALNDMGLYALGDELIIYKDRVSCNGVFVIEDGEVNVYLCEDENDTINNFVQKIVNLFKH